MERWQWTDSRIVPETQWRNTETALVGSYFGFRERNIGKSQAKSVQGFFRGTIQVYYLPAANQEDSVCSFGSITARVEADDVTVAGKFGNRFVEFGTETVKLS